MLPILIISIAVIVFVYAIYKWIIRNNDFFKNIGIPFHKPHFFVGNTGGFWFKQYPATEFIKSIYDRFSLAKIVGVYDFCKPVFLLRDPEVIKQLAVRDFDYFEDRNPLIDDKLDDLLGNSLFFLRGEKWRHMRATLSPAFTGSKMRQMFELVTETADEMASYFKNKTEKNKSIDCEMKEIFSKFTNDVIASTAFGIKVNSFENDKNEFYLAGQKFLNIGTLKGVFRILIIRTMPFIARKLNIQFLESSLSNFFKSMVFGNMETREREKIFRPDMINIMMNVRSGQSAADHSETGKDSAGFATVEESSIGKSAINRKWSENEIIAQCFVFFAAGFDTSSTLLSFVIYELSINHDIAKKLYDEVLFINTKLNGKRITYDVLQQMTYLDMVVSETLRFWPPAPFTDRYSVKDYIYDDGNHNFKIQKGSTIWIPIYALHHDAKYFPNPSKFDPERFNDTNKLNIVPGTYLPFGVGPRNCIGSRFALMEVKAIIFYFILNFTFEPNAKSQIPLKLKKTPIGIQAERGIHLTMKRR